MRKILVLNGPNLNLLGTREPEVYGNQTLADINTVLESLCKAEGAGFDSFQSNAEHLIVDRIHTARTDGTGYILFNPGAFTHTSVALRDALLGVDIAFIEVHISNVHKRESFRQHSYFSDIAEGIICGLGTQGYSLALQAALKTISPPQS